MLDVYFIHGCSLTGPSCCAAYLIEINKASSAVPASPTWQDEKSSSFRQGNLNPSRARFPKDFLGDLHLCIYIYLLRSIYSGMSMLRWGENSEWNMGAKNGNHFRLCLTWYFFRRFPLFFRLCGRKVYWVAWRRQNKWFFCKKFYRTVNISDLVSRAEFYIVLSLANPFLPSGRDFWFLSILLLLLVFKVLCLFFAILWVGIQIFHASQNICRMA